MNAKQRRTARRAEVRHNPKAVGRPPKVGVEKGRGPRHADNIKEGEDLTAINTDTVPAMLTPREAVLNRNAAELAGRPEIEALNAKGNALAKRGVDLAAEGDEDVPYPMRLPLEGAQVPQAEAGERYEELMQELEEALRRRGVPPLRGLSEGEESKDSGHQVEGYRVLAAEGVNDIPPWEEPTPLPSPPPPANVYNNWPPGWVSPSPTPSPSPVQENPFFASQQPHQGLQVINELGWDPSRPTYGFGSGEPTRRGIDIGLNAVGNATGIPGLGWGLGKLGRGLWHLVQNMQMRGASDDDIKKAVTQAQEDAGTTDAPTISTSDGGGGAGRGDKWHDIFGPRSSASGVPGVGVGISPTGQPAVGREWWSPDFGRYDLGGQGTGAGNYNLAGPGGWAIGSHGTGFGNQTVGNFATAIGFDRLGAGSGPSNLNFTAGAWGDDAREHFNPFFGGYSQSGLTSGRGVALRAQGDSDVEEESMNTKQSKQKPQRLQGGGMAGGTPPYGWQQHQANLATPGWQPPGQGGGLLGPPETLPSHQQMPYGWKQHQRNLGNTTIPGQGGAGGGGFYPQGQGFYAGGTSEVGISDLGGPGIGANFGAPPQLSAPSGLAEMVAALKKEAQKQGLSASQISGIMQAFQGMGGGGGLGGEATNVSGGYYGLSQAPPGRGYQGGISEVGYAPFASPRATFDPYRGWVGSYDPTYMIPAY